MREEREQDRRRGNPNPHQGEPWQTHEHRPREQRHENHISFHDHTAKQKTFIVLGLVAALALAVACFVGAHYLLLWIYEYTGTPSQVANSVLTVFAGIVVASVVFKLGTDLLQKVRPGAAFFLSRPSLLSKTVEALERISRGEFDTSIQFDSDDVDTPFAELAESVNRMANELGSMETLRQDFVSNVSHEIQSPLTSITGFAELLKKDDLTPQQRDHYIDIIETESRRLSKMSDNLLKLSSLESNATHLSSQMFKLSGQIEKAVLLLEPQWRAKNLDVSLDLDRGVMVVGDEDLLDQVWVNLITNAIKFTPRDGSLAIKLVVRKKDDGALYARVEITDSGVGISPEDQMHLFERFFKVDSSRNREVGGSGLGLSLVQKIIALHDGSIEIESDLGEGSTFIVTLPLVSFE